MKKHNNSAGDKAGQQSSISASIKDVSGKIAGALQNERTEFPTLSTEEEINALKHGKIPAEIIYSGEAGKALTAIDHKGLHPYTVMVNNGFSNMFISHAPEFSDHKHLRKCLGEMEERIDIGTGNGIVSNTVAFTVHTATQQAKMKKMIDAMSENDYSKLPSAEKTKFISCDLSKSSLTLAEDLAKAHFHDLEQLFDLSYYHGTFQKLLAEEAATKPRLITMFNVLANFEYQELLNILKDVAKAMKSGDIFIPTFFQMHDMHQTMNIGLPFSKLTKEFYANRETKDRCVGAFSERYKIDKNSISYNVDRKNDGRDYIDVSLSTSQNPTLHVPSSTEDILFTSTDNTFEVFKSYRMTKQEITAICESIGLKIDDKLRLEDREGIHLAPVLYKP